MGKTRHFLFLFSAFLLSVHSSLLVGQTVESIPEETTSEKIVMGKAIYLARPIYPREASVNRISGTVEVRVLIDKDGNIIEARSLTGDLSLRAAAESAAMRSKFEPTTLGGKKARLTGTISFNFQLFDDWEGIGRVLSSIESGVPAKNYVRDPNELNWQGFETERSEYEAITKDETTVETLRATELMRSIERKLYDWNSAEYWYFRLGFLTSKLSYTAEKPGEKSNFVKYLADVRSLLESAPVTVPQERLDVLKGIIRYKHNTNILKSDRRRIVNLLIESYNKKLSVM